MVGFTVHSSLHLEQPSQVLRDLVGTYQGTSWIKAPCEVLRKSQDLCEFRPWVPSKVIIFIPENVKMSTCGEEIKSLYVHVLCFKAKYCSLTCQKLHWFTHKKMCRPVHVHSAELQADAPQLKELKGSKRFQVVARLHTEESRPAIPSLNYRIGFTQKTEDNRVYLLMTIFLSNIKLGGGSSVSRGPA